MALTASDGLSKKNAARAIFLLFLCHGHATHQSRRILEKYERGYCNQRKDDIHDPSTSQISQLWRGTVRNQEAHAGQNRIHTARYKKVDIIGGFFCDMNIKCSLIFAWSYCIPICIRPSIQITSSAESGRERRHVPLGWIQWLRARQQTTSRSQYEHANRSHKLAKSSQRLRKGLSTQHTWIWSTNNPPWHILLTWMSRPSSM